MERISVIVPIYHGKEYINDMTTQLERCAAAGRSEFLLEALFVNDDPQELIEDVFSEIISVKVLETDKNRGIHGARVRGLEACSGDYVLFLDQDDRIEENYFSSQLAHIDDLAAVVCKLIHEDRQFYDTRMPFEQVIKRDFILAVRNPIISPGQVLLRKEKIPQVWKNIRLENNGADDWLLWICMLAEGCEFALNPEILFEHVVEGNNESVNAVHMIESERELYRVTAEKGILAGRELEKLHIAVQAAEKGHIRLLSKFQKMFFVYNTWMELQEQGIFLEAHLIEKGVHSMAIYGCSYIGKRLCRYLEKGKIHILYFIDRNAAYLEESVPVYQPDETLPSVDMILISLVEGTERIKEALTVLSKAKVCTVSELFADMKRSR